MYYYCQQILLFCCRITQCHGFICRDGVELLVTFHNTICSSDSFRISDSGRSEKCIGFNDGVIFFRISNFVRNHRIFRRRNSLKVSRVVKKSRGSRRRGVPTTGGHLCDFSMGFPRKPLAPENRLKFKAFNTVFAKSFSHVSFKHRRTAC